MVLRHDDDGRLGPHRRAVMGNRLLIKSERRLPKEGMNIGSSKHVSAAHVDEQGAGVGFDRRRRPLDVRSYVSQQQSPTRHGTAHRVPETLMRKEKGRA